MKAIWDFITLQFAFNQDGATQSWLFLCPALSAITWVVASYYQSRKWEKYYREKYAK